MEYTAKRPFSHNGEANTGSGWRKVNGTVPRGAKVRMGKTLANELIKKRILYKTKEDKRAYIVHSGGPWFEVRYGQKVEKVQGKEKAEARRDELNA